MKKITAAVTAALLGAAVLVAPVATAAEGTAVVTKKSDYPVKKRNKFWRVVKENDPIVKYVGKKSTIDLGVSTCDYLRAGGDLYGLSLMLVELDADEAAEYTMIAVMAAAPVILCPEQGYKFE